MKVIVRGAVQGVGFRPFVYRLSREMQLTGWVLNSSQGVFIEVEGARDVLRQFLLRLENEKPPRAIIQSLEFSFLDAAGYDGFEIRYSEERGEKTVLILPDIAACADCVREIFDPKNRRFRYPFTNCTNCGPRFSIIEALPYDRPNTAMHKFAMCAECEREYHDPLDRRFHAQPNACPHCGPHLELWDAIGNIASMHHDALMQSLEIIRAGKILALKGIGGFQLIVDARNEAVVTRLRERKRREEKPFALMFPSLEMAREFCEISELEERLLLSPESPIVLLRKQSKIQNSNSKIAANVAPRNPSLGVMLPYTPLHHLLMRELGFPVVATSGNLSDEPICTDEHEALERLQNIADFFLVHDRPIVRHVDDSIVRVMRGREIMLRRARGYAPLPVHVKEPLPTVLAVGAHLKNSVALSVGTEIFISQHIGDLETAQAHAAFVKTVADLPRLYDSSPEIIACDMHPDYLSTKFAQGSALVPSASFRRLAENPEDRRPRLSGVPAAATGETPVFQCAARDECATLSVQHHFAHVLACMAENEIEPPVLGVSWDGTGYGADGTIWGGEFLRVPEKKAGVAFERVAHFRQFRLPGGAAAIKQPCRCALGVLFEISEGEKMLRDRALAPVREFSENEISLISQMLTKGVNAPVTSSAGRLFDAVAALIGLRQRASFEGQAAMELEFAIEHCDGVYPFQIRESAPHVVDWRETMEQIANDTKCGERAGIISAKFHNTLAEIVVAVARKIGEEKVVLTGGCFQNKYLTERCVKRLFNEGFRPYWHQRVPPNDGGIALGQIIAAARAFQNKTARSEGVV